MNIGIEFLEGYQEKSLTLVKLTKSRNGQTGTATFIFIQPTLFKLLYFQKRNLESISLIMNNEKITSFDIKVAFKEGKPFLLKAIFLFKNSNEWFIFLNFMGQYSKETGLSFLEK